jgi:lipoprotein-anchoring transpeptidase ErfK/SrfK
MVKSIILLIILVNIGYSNTIIVDELQKKFNQDVIELNVFKKRYNNYLQKNCQDNIICYQKKINLLKSWNTVKNDHLLNSYLKSQKDKLKYNKEYWNTLVEKLNTKNINLETSQFISIVDLNKQLYIVAFWDILSKKFYFIGKDYISSGNIHREKEIKFGEDHYLKTPNGIFKNKQGWRSNGKISDDNSTLGYGYKNRYIFYFGKQNSIRYNTFDKNKNKIHDPKKWKLITDQLSFAVHSHKSSKPMGEPNSHGCIRMTDELNRFLDNNSILHKNTFQGEKWIHKYSQEPNHPKYQNYAGEYLIVFNKI